MANDQTPTDEQREFLEALNDCVYYDDEGATLHPRKTLLLIGARYAALLQPFRELASKLDVGCIEDLIDWQAVGGGPFPGVNLLRNAQEREEKARALIADIQKLRALLDAAEWKKSDG